MKKAIKRLIPLLLVLTLLAGCTPRRSTVTGGSTASYKRASSGAPAEYALADTAATDYGYGVYYEVAEEEDVEAPAAAEPSPSENGTQLPTGRKIIRNAELNLQTREYDAFMTGLNSRIAGHGGYIESSYSNGSSYYSTRKSLRSMSLTVRIPSDKLDVFLDGVCGMANVLYMNVYSNDVTASYVDTEARLKALKTERDTLMALLEKAEKMEDIITIYQRISDVTYEIESYESRMCSYDDKIAYSTVNISVEEVERETVVVEETAWQEIARRLGENMQDLGEGFKEFFISFVSALPQLVLTVLFFLVIYIIIRAIVKKSRKKAAAKAAKTPAAPAKTAEKPAEKPADKK